MAESVSQFSYQAPTYFAVPFHLQNAFLAASHVMPTPVSASASVATVVAPVYLAAYSFPQNQQAQQLFQKDAQTITLEALATVKAALASSTNDLKVQTKKKGVPRKAAGKTWEDPTLADWSEILSVRCLVEEYDVSPVEEMGVWHGNWGSRSKDTPEAQILTCSEVECAKPHCKIFNDFHLFCGDLGNEVNDDILSKAFSRYPSFNKARVVRDKWTGKTKGYGFASFANASDLAAAMKEMNGKYVGNRPIKLRKSTWKDRIVYKAYERQKNQAQKKPKVQKKRILHK